MTLAGASAASALAIPSATSTVPNNQFFFIYALLPSYQYAFDAAVVRRAHVFRQPLRAEHVARDLDDDVVGVQVRVVVVALQPLHAGRARSQDLHFALEAVGAQALSSRPHLLFFAEAHLSRDVGTRQ